jgi:hypothetical protein
MKSGRSTLTAVLERIFEQTETEQGTVQLVD